MRERVDTTTRAYLDCLRRHRDHAAGPEAGGYERRGHDIPEASHPCDAQGYFVAEPAYQVRVLRDTYGAHPPDIHPRAKGRWGEEWGVKAVHTPVRELVS